MKALNSLYLLGEVSPVTLTGWSQRQVEAAEHILAVSGANGSTGLVDGLLGLMLRGQGNGKQQTQQS